MSWFSIEKRSLYFKINGKNIAELVQMDISELINWFEDLNSIIYLKNKKL